MTQNSHIVPASGVDGSAGRLKGREGKPNPSIAIVGGGIGGLALAHFLTAEGIQVELFEASEQFGGLGLTFEVGGQQVEQFYHCMLPTDDALLGLMRDIGYSTDIDWHETSFAVWDGKAFYPLNGALDLLKFSPLSFFDRLRLGATGVWGRLVSSAGLDDVTAQRWLSGLSGKRAFELFWKTLLQAKFGERYGDVPALWFWTRFNREKGERREAKGMPPGGYRALTDAIVASLRKRGAVLHRSAPVSSIEIDPSGRPIIEVGCERKTFDQAAVTVALPIADKLIRSGSTLRNKIKPVDFGINYLAVINLVLVSKKSFSPHYWVASIVRDMPFQGVVETSQLGPLERFGGRNLLYLMRYLDRDHSDYTADSDELKTKFLDSFFRQFPHIGRDDIEAAHLFRAPYVEPAYTAGYLRRRPPINVFESRVFLATTAQVYPTVTSWNGAVGFAREVADEILRSASELTSASESSACSIGESPSGGEV